MGDFFIAVPNGGRNDRDFTEFRQQDFAFSQFERFYSREWAELKAAEKDHKRLTSRETRQEIDTQILTFWAVWRTLTGANIIRRAKLGNFRGLDH